MFDPWWVVEYADMAQMRLNDLPPEIILAIFRNCTSIADVVRLSGSCRRIQSMLSVSHKILILYHVAESEFGPLHDALQLLTLNNSQPAHVIRDPPRSDSLLRQIAVVGRVAKRWEDIYPFCKWDSDFADRRLLSTDERYRLRRAVYRYWLYSHAFHTPMHPRTSRRIPQLVLQRAKLLHNWSTRELVEIEDFQATMRALISTEVCPSDSTLHAMCFGDVGHLHLYSAKQPLAITAQAFFHASTDGRGLKKQTAHDMSGPSGWGDPVKHYYVIEDMLKLDPRAVLWLYDHPQKYQVESYLTSLGEWFPNNGDTFSETLACVLEGREADLADDSGSSCFGIIEKNCK
jgi:hypothetical protein